MKRSGYFILLLVCLLQSGGLLLIYKMRQSYIQLEMRQKLKNSESRFETLMLTLDEYKKYRVKDDEISIHGKMYDIKFCKITGNKVELVALHDAKETDILQQIKNLIGNNTNYPGSKVPSQLKDLTSLDYVFPDHINQLFFFEKQQPDFFECVNSFSTFHPDVLIPPPRLA